MQLARRSGLRRPDQRPSSPAPSPEVLDPSPPAPRSLVTRLRLALGGAICGILLGTMAGALCGTLYGALTDDLSLGLDGALIGGLILAVPGVVYGGILAVTGKGLPTETEEAGE
jgi:predicted lipid-binding transport protein (Tim44 family)